MRIGVNTGARLPTSVWEVIAGEGSEGKFAEGKHQPNLSSFQLAAAMAIRRGFLSVVPEVYKSYALLSPHSSRSVLTFVPFGLCLQAVLSLLSATDLATSLSTMTYNRVEYMRSMAVYEEGLRSTERHIQVRHPSLPCPAFPYDTFAISCAFVFCCVLASLVLLDRHERALNG